MGFIRTIKLAELPSGTIREVSVEGKALAVANVDGKIYAINNACLPLHSQFWFYGTRSELCYRHR